MVEASQNVVRAFDQETAEVLVPPKRDGSILRRRIVRMAG
jgi:hypothetical protein